jgi:uncharacterized repeat protein (TIGR01451 family)/fimbrial isopeptide formation D2 family protein
VVAGLLSVGLLASGLTSVALVTGPAQPAAAAPGTPGEPQANTVLFAEDFENVTGTAPVGLAAYTGDGGQRYTADPAWLTACNGQIRSFNTPYTTLGNCASTAYTSNLGQLAYALGAHAEATDPRANEAVTAYTEGNPGVGAVQFRTVGNVPLASASGRFLTFSVDTAAVNCQVSAPLYQFSFLNESGAATNVGGVLNACTSNKTVDVPAYGTIGARAVNVGTFTSNGSVLFDGASLGIRMTNQNGSGTGNDAAFDNIRILDVTPQLDKAFSPAVVATGATSVLTFTVTNTAELAAKNGWSFTDTLPAGLTVADPSGTATTCPAGTVDADAGSSTITAGGNLSAGMESCTITVTVTSDTAGAYSNGPGNVEVAGLNEPGTSTVTFQDPPTWQCTADGYLFQSPSATSHPVYQVDLATGAYTTPANTTANVNGVGFNPTDNYVYGVDASTQNPVRIGSDGTVVQLPRPAGFIPLSYNVGDFDEDGHLWISIDGQNYPTDAPWFEIDYAAGSSTYGQIIDSGTFTTNLTGPDWTFLGGSLYGIATNSNHLIRFDTTSHAQTDLGPISDVPASIYGATYGDAATGSLYASNNATGAIYRVDAASVEGLLVTDAGPASGQNDGARCATAPIPTITVTKTVEGRAHADDQFTVGLNDDGGDTLASATTTGADATVSTTNFPVSQGQTYTITDAMAAGSANALSAYTPSIVCTNTTNDDPVPTDGVAGAWTLQVTTPDPITCDVTNTPAPGQLSVTKTADQTELPAIGEQVEYTVVVTNEGPGVFTADAPGTATDDLSDVLDDADLVPGSITADIGEAAYAGGQITWSGPLAAGQSATITYTVTYNGEGDSLLINRACVPADQVAPGALPCDAVRIPAANAEYWKTVDPASGTAVQPGQELTYTLSFRNDGQAAGDVDATDDLSAVLDDADLIGGPTASNAALTAAVTGSDLSVTGSVPAGATYTVTYTVRVKAFADQGDGTLTNALTDPNGVCLIGDCTTTNPVAHLSIDKTSDAAEGVTTGDSVTYTVTVVNDGQAAFSDEAPASATDDLSGVLDDATFDGEATATVGEVSYAAPVLTWTGPLGVGESAEFSYTVTVTNTGDHVLENTASLPAELCTENCGSTTTTNLPHVVPGKTSDPATGEAVQAGDVITYTLTFTNDGAAAGPVDSTDDLSEVLDDAEVTAEPVSDTDGVTATRTGDRLRVVGALGAGQTATVTYEVTVRADGERGDDRLGNVLTPDVPVVECTDDGCDEVPPPSTEHPVGELDDWKTVDPASGTAVRAGQEVTYTLHFANTGEGDVAVDREDVLVGVLDDADLTAAPVASDEALAVSEVTDGRFAVTGTLAAGQEATVTYTATVRGDGERGDDRLGNFLVDPGQDPPAECEPAEGERPDCTLNAVQHLSIEKSSDVDGVVNTGDTVTYTVTVTNDGQVPFTAEAPASATDDLTGVLDDASFNDDAEATVGEVSYAAPTLTWTGPLGVGDSASFTYSVTVTNAGDHVLENSASLPAELCTDGCDSTTTTNLPHVVPGKTSDPATGEAVQAGDVVTYTLTFTNDGAAAGPVDSTDDLSGVLDDAEVTAEPVSDTEGITATRTDDRIRVVGTLDAGQAATITYQVTVKADGDRGDNVARNVLTPDVPVLECTDDGCEEVPPPSTEHPVGALDDWKTVDPASGTAVRAGQELTYTLHFVNTGEGDVRVAREDVLTGVLDDADLTAAPTASDEALTVSDVVDGRIGVTGTLAAGQEATVTYTATVRGDGQRGDDRLGNFLVGPGQDPPAECEPAEGEHPDCTVNYVSGVTVAKTSDPESGTEVEAGQEVTYTLTFTSTTSSGDAPAEPVAYTDHMADVLDDATLTGDPVTSDEALQAAVDGDTIVVTGELAGGRTATVTYTVTVKDGDDQGNGSLGNVVALTGTTPVCAEGSPLCTVNPVEQSPTDPAAPTPAPSEPAQAEDGGTLPKTGVMVGGIAGAAALLLGLGLLAMRVARRRTQG